VSRPSDDGIARAIQSGTGQTVMPLIAYRQALALETIAEQLAELVSMMQPPTMIAPEAVNDADLKPGPLEAIGPALQHRRRRSGSEG